MSAAAASSPVAGPTRGYAQIPNSLIENQVTFTRAELALALIVLRRGGQGGPVSVSDRNWVSWTGLSPRLKEYAVVGLRKKCLVVEGRGDSARYSFARDHWDGFVRTLGKAEPKARTAGRAVDPKPGSKVHPECRARGCAMLAPGTGPKLVSPSVVTPFAQPVARTGQDSYPYDHPDGARSCNSDGPPSIPPSPVVVTPNAQRVAQTVAAAWVKTLAALQALFPLVGVAFLARLVAVVVSVCSDVTDSELAEAVGFAWLHKRKRQEQEGLFLFTVPNAVVAIRRRAQGSGARLDSPGPGSEPDYNPVRDMVRRVAEALRGRGAPFAPILAELARFPEGKLEAAETEEALETIEKKILRVAEAQLTEAQRWKIDALVEAELKPYREKLWTKAQLTELGRQVSDREILHTLKIPRLSIFYA